VGRIPPHDTHGVDTLVNTSDGIYDAATQIPLVALPPIPTREFTAGIP
jgi:hypothetical protein